MEQIDVKRPVNLTYGDHVGNFFRAVIVEYDVVRRRLCHQLLNDKPLN
jgi:hypothetical protein